MLDLIEYGSEQLISREAYNDEDRIFLSKLQYEDITKGECRFYLRENEMGLYIKPMNYVGTIQLSSIRINIIPRFDHNFAKLIKMIIFTRNAGYKSFKQDIDVIKAEDDLYEIIISLLLEEVLDILKNNIFKEYVNYDENLKVIRGRIDFNNHLIKNFCRGDKIYCRYDDLNYDVIENKIILRALNIAAKITSDNNKKKLIKKYIDIFSKICSEYRGNKFPEIRYNRLNSNYIDAHYYSRLLIESIGTENMYRKGEHHSRYSLLIDNNELFEKFVAALFAKYLSSDFDINPQYEVYNALLNQQNKTYRKIIPDIFLKSRMNNDFIIIDTKNKAYGNNNVINEDIYQLSFYGLYFYSFFKQPAKIFIIYPQYADENAKHDRIFINTVDNILPKPYINVRSININEYLDLIGRGIYNKDKIREHLMKMLF